MYTLKYQCHSVGYTLRCEVGNMVFPHYVSWNMYSHINYCNNGLKHLKYVFEEETLVGYACIQFMIWMHTCQTVFVASYLRYMWRHNSVYWYANNCNYKLNKSNDTIIFLICFTIGLIYN
jgi:hypothetical protein